MTITREQVECLRLPYYRGEKYDLDPIRVVLIDHGEGRGGVILECFGDAYAHYWGAMSDRTVREFITTCNEGYLVDKLMPDYLFGTRLYRQREVHLSRIVRRVREALAGEPQP